MTATVPGQRAPGRTCSDARDTWSDPAVLLGAAAIAISIALTLLTAALGPSLVEPALPGRAAQPPWGLGAHPSPSLIVIVAAAAVGSGAAGLTVMLRAARRGAAIAPRLVLTAGIAAALALAFLPPFGSADHLSYAAFGRMVVTGHDPYSTTPAMLARIGDPVARAVPDWRHTPSVYGPLAVAAQGLAAWIGRTSVRLIVFVLSLLNVLAFGLTGLALHWLGRGDRQRQLRAALLWTCNPLLLFVLIAGAHVDSLAVLFGICALAVGCAAVAAAARGGGLVQAGLAVAAGALTGLGFAVKVTAALVGAGLAIGFLLVSCVQQTRTGGRAAGQLGRHPGSGDDGGGGRLTIRLGGLAAGFCLTAGASLAVWGTSTLIPAVRAVSWSSIGSPWRPARSLLALAVGGPAAERVIAPAAVLLALSLLGLMLRAIRASGGWPADAVVTPGSRPADSAGTLAGRTALLTAAAFAVVFAWLLAWPYVLPWYDALGWATLALLPWSRFDWLVLARTTALAVGYLPARGSAAFLPGGLRWLETVVRTAVTPAALLVVLVLTVTWLSPRPARSWHDRRRAPEGLAAGPGGLAV